MVKIRKTASVENGIMQVLNILSDEEILEAIATQIILKDTLIITILLNLILHA